MADAQYPKSVRTLDGIADLIRAEFNISCDRMKVSYWQRKVKPPFPRPGKNNEFDVTECFAWVKAFQKRRGHKAADSADAQLELLERRAESARLNSKIRRDEEEQFDFETKKGKFIDRELANRTIMATIREYHEISKKNITAIAQPDLAKQLIVSIEADCKRIATGEV